MTEPKSTITLNYSYRDAEGTQNINMNFDGDLVLSAVLRQLRTFITSIGYGCDVLTSSVEVQGDTYEHSSEDF